MNRNGLSLLEVILSIAILGVSMAAIGNLFNLGLRHARQAQLRSDANILCDTKMAELVAGVIPAESTGNQTIAENPNWDYSIDIQNSEQVGLLIATVTVNQVSSQNGAPTSGLSGNPVSLSIVRFLPDPDYEPEE